MSIWKLPSFHWHLFSFQTSFVKKNKSAFVSFNEKMQGKIGQPSWIWSGALLFLNLKQTYIFPAALALLLLLDIL